MTDPVACIDASNAHLSDALQALDEDTPDSIRETIVDAMDNLESAGEGIRQLRTRDGNFKRASADGGGQP